MLRHRIAILAWFCVLVLGAFQLSIHFALAASSKRRYQPWAGTYLNENGLYQIEIIDLESDQISIDISRVDDLEKKWRDRFIAVADGGKATHTNVTHPKKCRIELYQEDSGVRVADFCSAPKEESGLFKRVRK